MEENNLNAEAREVVQPGRMGEQLSESETTSPQYDENGADDTGVSEEEITEPQKAVDEMSDEEFLSYINSAQHGNAEVQGTATEQSEAETAEDNAESEDDAGDTDPTHVEKTEPFKVFNTKEDYQSEFNRIIGERLKKSREGMETLEGLKHQALNFYGAEDGDAAIAQLIEDLNAQNAEKKGVSVEDYKQQSQDSIDAQKYRDEQSRIYDEQRKIADIQSRWQRESKDLKAIIHDFDFAEAMQNKTFYEHIVNGASVSTAYLAANKAAAPAVKQQRKAIPQNGNMRGSGAGKVEANPAAMSDADFARYIERIKG